MRSVLITVALAAAVVTAAPQIPLNYPSVFYINSAAGLATNSNSPILELSLSSANPDPPKRKTAVVVLSGGEATGTILLTQHNPPNGEVEIVGTIFNLTTGIHGFHIHTTGVLDGGCGSTGGHYNPYKREHGSPQNLERHVGDLGNIVADKDGIARINIVDQLVTLEGPTSVIGRAIVVHDGEDDLGTGGHPSSLTTGNAGGRLVCGVIGIGEE
ncbi:uncharacterized protein LOC126983035 isoform X2 [Eriocheir sinensis]|uniref:uncharacterized protein LOC126983035 isoform X2 n=1 Tax=Eriocheir sinensis TaxID=95602 RepID=UPI0021C6B4AC|nr:uncharacterized protein LOC126983035 isoform X2 [Eriocheir sinensis]